MKNYLLILLLLFSSNIIAQKSSKVTAEWTYIGNKTQSIEEIEREAINRAKIKALEKAGVKERVKTYSSLFRRTENQNYDKVFTSSFFSEKEGAVTEYKIIEKSHSYKEGLPVCYVKIKANVIKYETKTDYSYKASISGITPVYYSETGEYPLEFDFTPTKDTYLTIFGLWNEEIILLFPSELEAKHAKRDESTIFKKNKKYIFGDDPAYTLYNEKEKSTGYRLIFVMHKEENIFSEELNIDNMWKWIFEIPRELRNVEIENFTVYNKK